MTRTDGRKYLKTRMNWSIYSIIAPIPGERGYRHGKKKGGQAHRFDPAEEPVGQPESQDDGGQGERRRKKAKTEISGFRYPFAGKGRTVVKGGVFDVQEGACSP